MIDEKFRDSKVSITRDEFAEIVAVETLRIMKNVSGKIDADEADKVRNLLMMFGANLMDILFDEGRPENLEVE